MSKIPKLFELMEQRGITAKKLSTDTNISTGNISDWKSGRSKPSSDKLKLLADYFDVSTDYLLGNEQKECPIPPLSDTEQEVLDLFKKLTPEEQAAHLAFLRARNK